MNSCQNVVKYSATSIQRCVAQKVVGYHCDLQSSSSIQGDERIGVAQVGDVLRALGQNPTEAEIQKCCSHWTDPGIIAKNLFI